MAAMNAMRSETKDGWKAAGHDKDFKPQSMLKERIYRSSYPYMEQGPKKRDPKSLKNADGDVIIEERNIVTNPIKKGQVGKNVLIGERLPFQGDDYEAQKKLDLKKREYHNSKIQDKAFCSRAKHTDHFFNNRATHEENPPVPPRKAPVVEEKKGDPLHDKPFKPSNPNKKGRQGAIEKFPAHVPDPIFQAKKKAVVDENAPESPPGFKMTYKYKSRPSPSVATNIRNLKASFPSAFRK